MQICLILAVLYFLLFALVKGGNADKLIREIEKARREYQGIADAEILEVAEKKVMRSTAYYYPTFLYVVDGKSYGESAVLFSTGKQDFLPGKRVQVRYDINNPGEFIPVDDCALYQMAENVKSGSRMMLAVAAAAGIAAVFFPDIFSRY